jgi:TPR repeat protein
MELAARNGDVPAMLKVGILQLMGVNGRVELAEAKQWLYQASQKGNKMALQVLQEMALAEEGRSAFDFNGHSFLNAGWDQRLAVTAGRHVRDIEGTALGTVDDAARLPRCHRPGSPAHRYGRDSES